MSGGPSDNAATTPRYTKTPALKSLEMSGANGDHPMSQEDYQRYPTKICHQPARIYWDEDCTVILFLSSKGLPHLEGLSKDHSQNSWEHKHICDIYLVSVHFPIPWWQPYAFNAPLIRHQWPSGAPGSSVTISDHLGPFDTKTNRYVLNHEPQFWCLEDLPT